MEIGSKYSRLFYYLSWVINLLLLVIVFASISKVSIANYFGSDSLYLASLYKDIFVDGTGLSGWHLNAAPNFFPDMFLYFITNAIFSDFRVAYIVFSCLQYLLILSLLNLLVVSVIPGIKTIYLTFLNMVFPIFLLIAINSGLTIYSYYLLSHSFHNGVFINTLLASVFLFKYLHTKRKLFLFLSAIIALIAVYNDRLFLVLFSIPLIPLLIINFFRFKNKQINVIVPIIVGVSAISLFLYNSTALNSVFKCIGLGEKYMNYDNILPSLNAFIGQHINYLKHFEIKGLVSIITIINFFVLLILIIKNLKRKNEQKSFKELTFYTFIFASIFLTLLTPIINGYYNNEATARFHIFSFWLSVFNLTFFAFILFRKNEKYPYLITVLFFVLYTGFITVKFAQLPVTDNIKMVANYYPEKVTVVDDFTKKHNLRYGLANYWVAKFTTLLSHNELRVYTAANENLSPWFHVMNKNWYFDYDKGKYNRPVFNFILLDGFDKEKIKENFGKPKDSLVYQNETILYVMKDIKFNREDNRAYLVN
jgi:hypothetical protein